LLCYNEIGTSIYMMKQKRQYNEEIGVVYEIASEFVVAK
jgi:hypothetical protein